MFSNTLDNKPFFQKSDGNIIKDLTETIFDFNVNNFVTYTAYRVPKEYVMRPDLISQAVYNNTSYTELILKYNGISNPFSIDQDDIILIPGLDSAKQNIKARVEEGDVSKQIRNTYKYIDPTKKPKIDENAQAFDDRDLTDGALPPNIAPENVSQIDVRNGRVFFGESIGQSACLKNGMTNSEFLTTVIKSRKTPPPILASKTPAQKIVEKKKVQAVKAKIPYRAPDLPPSVTIKEDIKRLNKPNIDRNRDRGQDT